VLSKTCTNFLWGLSERNKRNRFNKSFGFVVVCLSGGRWIPFGFQREKASLALCLTMFVPLVAFCPSFFLFK
jgi:hypothetical protein